MDRSEHCAVFDKFSCFFPKPSCPFSCWNSAVLLATKRRTCC